MLRLVTVGAVCAVVGFLGGLATAPMMRGSGKAVTGANPEQGGGEGAASSPVRPASLAAPASPRLPAVPRLTVAPPVPAGDRPESPAKFEELPATLQQVLSQISQGREVRRLMFAQTTREGKLLSTAGFEVEGMRHRVMVDDRGSILESDADFAVEDVPPVVTNSIRGKFPGAVLLDAKHKEHLDKPRYFDVQFRFEGRRWAAYVGEDGQMIKPPRLK